MNMSQAEVRPGTEQDINAIVDLVSQLKPLVPHARYAYWNLLSNFGDSCFVAEDEERVVGLMTSHPTSTPPDEWFIWQAGVLPEYRGTGLIDQLYDSVADAARQHGAIALRATIETDNPRSLGAFTRFATRLGSTVDEQDRFNLEGQDAPDEVLYRIPLVP
jgi:L-2,4-diaminobutyric acid acetyltransferase